MAFQKHVTILTIFVFPNYWAFLQSLLETSKEKDKRLNLSMFINIILDVMRFTVETSLNSDCVT